MCGSWRAMPVSRDAKAWHKAAKIEHASCRETGRDKTVCRTKEALLWMLTSRCLKHTHSRSARYNIVFKNHGRDTDAGRFAFMELDFVDANCTKIYTNLT